MTRLKGLRELNRKLGRIGKVSGRKVLTKAVRKASTPTLRAIRASAPVGQRESHKTYKGRTVFKGFLKRSVSRRMRFSRRFGTSEAFIGVKKEAFYGPAFLDKGINVKKRKQKRSKGKAKKLKAYSIQGRRWFASQFESRGNRMQEDLRKELAADVEKELRRG